MTFRNNARESVITGTMAPIHHRPWKDALDDDLKSTWKTSNRGR